MISPAEHPAPLPNLADEVKARLGEKRLAALDKQPMAQAAGGIAKVVETACAECAGYPHPVLSASIRTLQLCGSRPTPNDLKD